MKIDIAEKTYRNQKIPALKDIYLNFHEGENVLVIGTSGAGKSTLLKCILGTTTFEGCVDTDRETIAYIPQHPALNPDLSVYQTISFSIKFSQIDGKHKNEDVDRLTDFYISEVALGDVKYRQCKRLSGGQMQRVSIAKELARGKSVIIADEIDTGLDCGVARHIVKTLCDITHRFDMTHRKKLTTIVVSHNLVNVDLYDKIVVLVKPSGCSGQVAFFGTPIEAKFFFGVDNYVDILTKLNNKDEGGEGKAEYYIRKFKRYYAHII